MFRWLHDRLGSRRSAALLLAAAWAGYALIIPSRHDTWVTDEAMLHLLAPEHVRQVLWLAAAAAAIIGALWRRGEPLAWIAASAPPYLYAASHLGSWLMWVIPGAPGGTEWAGGYAIFWGSLAGLTTLLSRWAEDSPARLERTRDAG